MRAAILMAAGLVLCAGCTSPVPRHSAPHQGAPRPQATTVGPAPAVAGFGAVTTSLPGCTTTAQAAPALPAADTAREPVPGRPFGIAVTGKYAFVSLGATVGVYRIGPALLPAPVRQIPTLGTASVGAALDGTYLVVANGASGATVISVPAAEASGSHAVAGQLAGAGLGGNDAGAIEVAVSRDGRYAFVSMEDDDVIAVFRMPAAGGSGDYIGSIPTQVAPVGLAVSPDGRWLYATSEERDFHANVGTLTVINVAEAETDPAHSVVASTPAGCNPVRVVTSANGSVVWVTARASDALLAFSAAMLRTDPAHALLADVPVGELPVGLALVRSGSLVVVADSNRFDVPGAAASLAVVNVADALAHKPALIGYLPAGHFPREMALEPGGATLLVGDFASQQLEAVDVAALP